VLTTEECPGMSAGTGRFSGDAEMTVVWRRFPGLCSRWRKRQPERLRCKQRRDWPTAQLVLENVVCQQRANAETQITIIIHKIIWTASQGNFEMFSSKLKYQHRDVGLQAMR